MSDMAPSRTVSELIASYRPSDPVESIDVERVLDLAMRSKDPWSQEISLHVTASAIVVHPATGRVLLRWHTRQQAWLQIGGHGDPGETDPVAVAQREGLEETGLPDLVPWPTADLLHVVVVPVAPRAGGGVAEHGAAGVAARRPATHGSGAHEHADLRFVLATERPDSARPEQADAELRWLTIQEATALTSEANLHETLRRVALLFDR